jgi:hypothetical protein
VNAVRLQGRGLVSIICLWLVGCANDDPVISRTVTGTVLSCRDDQKLIDVITEDGTLVRLDVIGVMPMCGAFKKGGTWQFSYHGHQGGYANIDSVRRVGMTSASKHSEIPVPPEGPST